MMPKPVIKGICFFLAALMILSAVAVLVQVFALDSKAMVNYVSPAPTGDSLTDIVVPAGVILLAVLAIGICIFLPKLKAKNDKE